MHIGFPVKLKLIKNFSNYFSAQKSDYVCPEGYGNGNFADPATCRRFYQVSTIALKYYSDLAALNLYEKSTKSYFVYIFSFLKSFL